MGGPSSFWMVPASHAFNCTEGCANCFFLAFGSTRSSPSGSKNMVARIGFIFNATEMADMLRNEAALWPRDADHLGLPLFLSSNGEQDFLAPDNNTASSTGGSNSSER